MTRDHLINVIEDTAVRAKAREPEINERARAFVAELSGALEHDHPETARQVFSLLEGDG